MHVFFSPFHRQHVLNLSIELNYSVVGAFIFHNSLVFIFFDSLSLRFQFSISSILYVRIERILLCVGLNVVVVRAKREQDSHNKFDYVWGDKMFMDIFFNSNIIENDSISLNILNISLCQIIGVISL